MMSQFAPAKKSLGQNFLQSSAAINRIVEALHVQSSDTVLEIGPGQGALTDILLSFNVPLILVEFDKKLAQYWQDKQRTQPHLSVHQQDILKFELESVLIQDKSLKIVGNLPYNISSPILFYLLNYAADIDLQVFMLQKEVVQRITACPSNKQYGRLSVILQQRYDLEYLFTIPPSAFKPAPKVDSAILRMIPQKTIQYPVVDNEHFQFLVKTAFSQRRKTVRNTLKNIVSDKQFEQVNIDPVRRAETLSVEEFVALSNSIAV